MAVDPFLSFEAALPAIIAEHPSLVNRTRETAADTFHSPQIYTAGTYQVRIEPLKAGSASDIWDEKGATARLLFTLLGYNIPRTVTEGGKDVPTFRLNDTITDTDGNVFTVVAPQFIRGKMVQLVLELRG